MAPYRRPYDLVADLRRGAEAIRQQELEATVRQFVRVGELAADSVTAAQIVVGAVGNTELQDGAVGRVKIANGAVNADKVEARTLLGDRLVIGGVGGTEMQDGGVGTVELANGAVTAPKASIGQLSALSADLGVVTAGLIQGPTIQTAASGIRTVLDTGGLRLFNSATGSDSWSSAQWFLTDGSDVTGAIRCQLPTISGGQYVRQEVSAFLAGIAPDTNTSCQISVRGSDGSLLGRCQVFGNGSVVVSSTPTVSSDRNLKQDISDLGESLAKVRKLKPRTYKRRGNGGTEIGFVAQEVREVFPDVVHEIPPSPEDPKPVLGVQYESLIPPVVRSVQELADRLDAHDKRITALEPPGQVKKP